MPSRAAPPEASLTLTRTSLANEPGTGFPGNQLPVSVHADASASKVTDSPIASYSFDFGDGSPAVGPQAEPTADHTYWIEPTRWVTVTVTDVYGRSSTAQQGNYYMESSPPNSSFETHCKLVTCECTKHLATIDF